MINLFRTTNSVMVLISILAIFRLVLPAFSGEPWIDWQNTDAVENTLIGKIWSAQENKYVSPSDMIQKLSSAKYVLAGEVHDNHDHHLLQAWIVNKIAQSGNGTNPAIVMEMIRSDKGSVLAEYMDDPTATSTGLANVLEWDKSGWPQWSYYEPIANAVFKHGLQLFAGDPARALLREVGRNGYKGIAADRINLLAIDKILPTGLAEALDTDIVDSHCKLLPAAMIAPMVKVQRFRDASLARAMVDIGGRAILIAGNGHVRSDRGVPWYLGHQDSAADALSIMMIEVDNTGNNIQDLLELGPDGTPAADFFWFTPKAEREDQCEKLRKRFKPEG